MLSGPLWTPGSGAALRHLRALRHLTGRMRGLTLVPELGGADRPGRPRFLFRFSRENGRRGQPESLSLSGTGAQSWRSALLGCGVDATRCMFVFFLFLNDSFSGVTLLYFCVGIGDSGCWDEPCLAGGLGGG